MTIQDWGAIGELLGSIAVLVTLIYLATQVRIARRTIATSAIAELHRAFSSVNQQVIGSEEVALIYSRGLKDPASLSESERIRFGMLVREALNGYFDLFRQYQNGEIDKRTFERFGFAVYVCIPGIAQFLESTAETLEPDLQSYILSVPKIDGKEAYRLIMGTPIPARARKDCDALVRPINEKS